MSVPAAGTRSNGKCRSAKISKPLFEECITGILRKRFEPREVPTFDTLIDPWEEAQAYTRLGLAVVPLPPGKKPPAIRWEAYQTVAPKPNEIDGWWQEWPDAGMAVVLGPVSNVLAIDVDGPDANAELVRRLGGEPVAPKILTGSGKPCRYQLLFSHPTGLSTRAKITPWHSQLEFRGLGGLSVLPPSVHPSGRRYRWAEGRSLEEMELPELPPLVLDALRVDAEARDDRAGVERETVTVWPDHHSNVQTRALALLTKRLTAVEGAGGDKATYTAACYLVKDFGLSINQALPVLKAWNRTNCRPKWSDAELLHKLQKAAESPGQRGRLLDAAPTHPTAIANTPSVPKADVLSGPAFTTAVPDWVEYIWEIAKPRPAGVRKGRPRIATIGMLHLLFANVVLQKKSVVEIPDVPLAQLVWGGDRTNWPKRWRRKLAAKFGRVVGGKWFQLVGRSTTCSPECPLAGTRHRHLRFRLVNESALDLVLPFATEISESGEYTYDFAGRRSHHPKPEVAEAKTKEIRELVKDGLWCAIYLPAWVFGPHALPPGPCRILKAATRELTRERGRKARRPDHAELVPGTVNPLLDDNTVYVAFNGNGSRKRPQFHGRGYSLKTCMMRAGYPHDPDAPSFRASAKEYFTDLKNLTESLGLVAAVRVPDRDGWLTADEAMDEVGVVAPAKLARKCLIKLFAPANYADLWRAYFASKLGLSVIPRGGPGEFVPTPAGASITTSEQLARWMKAAGLGDAELAEQLGVDRTAVCRFRTGSRAPSGRFLEKLAAFVAETASEIERV
jgi:hypothetical protein